MILPTGVGPFLLMFSPIFFVFWSPIFTRLGESYTSDSNEGLVFFGYHFLLLTLFLLELLNMRLANKNMAYRI
ncbi:hypothetical protein NITGR_300004 [Nitrospina gracilis 3/211]|uniref:Uncharacterized protein n=1 Tax=Nitrospina gracilis (strain 3/211) TaxID=1266370 RepID=M1YZ24_NITG3|nr:hypothetical protein NITGR_300004 [Nitrospina gracilis 3/211]